MMINYQVISFQKIKKIKCFYGRTFFKLEKNLNQLLKIKSFQEDLLTKHQEWLAL